MGISRLLPCGSNSGIQVWQQVPVPSEPSELGRNTEASRRPVEETYRGAGMVRGSQTLGALALGKHSQWEVQLGGGGWEGKLREEPGGGGCHHTAAKVSFLDTEPQAPQGSLTGTDVPAFSKQRQRPGATEQHRQDPFQNCSQEPSPMNQGKMEAPLPRSCWDQSPGLSSPSAHPDRYHWDPALEGMSVKLVNLSRVIHSSSVIPESRGRV